MDALSAIFGWINDQLLRMDWLSRLVALFVRDVLGLSVEERIGGSIHFFLYDTVKIFVLLSVLIFVVSLIQSYFPPERTRALLGKRKGFVANLMGALLGTVTPFCSCSSIPLFIGFTRAGLPVGVTFSFLISSPLVDLASVLLLASIFNWKMALAYVVAGLILAVVGGSLISRFHMERYVESFVRSGSIVEGESHTLSRKERMLFARDQVLDIIRRVWVYVLAGVGIGALIHNWVPESLIAAVLGKENAFSVLIATVAGVPMYADIFGTLPVAEALLGKGVGTGTVLAFMMAVTALSLPSLVLLRKVVKRRLLLVFAGLVTAGILVIGYAFNALSGLLL